MPPEPSRVREPIVRERLLVAVRGRFEHRLVALVAGAGFGKSTLVRQAMADNLAAPRGIDACVECTADDAHLSEFAARLLSLLDIEGSVSADPKIIASAVVDAIALRSPIDVCLIIEDGHLLNGSPAWALVRSIVDQLPPNGHLLVSTRTEPDVPLARLVARGQALLLDEDALSFTAEECVEFGRRRGIDFTSNPIAWPALAELAALGAGPRLRRAYLVQEVVETMSPAVRHLLGAVVIAEGADDELASAMVGYPVNIDHELQGVPLIHVGDDGWAQPHDLWRRALGDLLTPDEQRHAQDVAAFMLARRGRYAQAIRLHCATRSWDAAGTVALTALRIQPPAIDTTVLAKLLELVPGDARSHPGWQLAGALVTYEGSLPAARTALERLADTLVRTEPGAPAKLTAVDSDEALVSTLFHLATVGRRMADEELLATVAERLDSLVARRHPRAIAVNASVRGFLAQIHGHCAEGLEALDNVDHGSISPEQSAHVLLMAGNLHLLDDRPDLAATRYLEAAAQAKMPVRLLAEELHATAVWVAGWLDEAIHEERRCLDAAERLGLRSRAAQYRAMLAAMLATAGRIDDARSVFAALPVQSGSHSADVETRALSLLTLALIAVADGDRDRAADHLRKIPEPDGNLQRALFLPAASVVVLAPERRAAWEAVPAKLIRAAVAQARAIETPPPSKHPSDSPSDPKAAKDPEAAKAVRAARADDSRPNVQPRPALLPALLAPSHARIRVVEPTLRLDVLGPVRLDPLADPAPWRRSRVRELAAAIALLGPRRREELAEVLWPDHPDGVADRNLRVNLSYLADAVEPERTRGVPTSLLLVQGTLLAIAPTSVRLDLSVFDDCGRRARAAEQDNDPASALAALTEGVALWRGDVAADLDCEWLEMIRRQRRAQFVAMASRAGELALGQGELEAAVRFAHLVLDRDPSHERAGRLHAACLLASGDRRAAIEAMQACLACCDDLGVDPEPETIVLATRLGIGQGLG